MTAALCALLAVAFGTTARDESSEKQATPSYTAGSLANPANNRPGPFAPNQLVSLRGSDLAYSSDTASPDNIKGNLLPVKLKPGVQIMLLRGKMGTPMPLQMVSPTRINFLLPESTVPGDVDIAVFRDGIYGPVIRFPVQDAAPALVESTVDTAVAAHADGRLVTAEDPAVPGESVVLYATGLGPTVLRLQDGEIPMSPPLPAAGLAIRRLSELRVLLDGQPVEPSRVSYAGLVTGVPALYQVVLRLPCCLAPNPEFRLVLGDRASPEGVRVPLRPPRSNPREDPVGDPLSPDPE